MKVVHTIAEVRNAVAAARDAGRRIGLVPTMGALHAGHLSLVEAAKAACDFVVVSIFVNPTQFGPDEDLDTYPQRLDADAKACRRTGVDLIFAPAANEMYATGFETFVEVDHLAKTMCGTSRPGHFRGVCTVVCKLLNIVRPDAAFFGQKDYQQATILRRMVEDLNIDVEIVICPIVREPDGLAMSSRNVNLSASQRSAAVKLSQALLAARDTIAAGQTDAKAIRRQITDALETIADSRVDYVAVVAPDTLADIDKIDGPVLMAVAVFVGEVRLIDNVLTAHKEEENTGLDAETQRGRGAQRNSSNE